MSERYTWRDVQSAADHYFTSLYHANRVPALLVGFVVSKGSVTYGHSGDIVYVGADGTTDAWTVVPGGKVLPQRAKDAYNDLILRSRMVDELLKERR
jgi:TRAP-type mannitol/chloroaromatic compound transport system substrate-binding protein